MKSRKLIYLILLLPVLILIYHQSIAQMGTPLIKPPVLKNQKNFDNYLRLGYRAPVDSFMVIIMKFKISANGSLDTLYISKNAPDSFVKSAKEQLNQLNGYWVPQLINGKPTKSKWLISRYYVSGFREDSSSCTKRRKQEIFDAYKRDEELFLCTYKEGSPRKCLMEFIEGYDYYLYPPMLVTTLR